jgi:diguanylate cyclase (GGDEF)-like protein
MAASSSDILKLRAPTPSADSCRLEPLVARLLDLIVSSSERGEGPPVAAARKRLQALGASLVHADSAGPADEILDEVLSLCMILIQSGGPLSGVAKELSAAVSLVREAVRIMTIEEREFDRTLTESAGRFEALRNSADIQVLRQGLAEEVATLRQVAVVREAQWQRRVDHVEGKVRSLEDRLAETQLQAAHDQLTGLVNRRTVERYFGTYAAGRRSFILGILDIDDFKGINDALGHLTGDEALKAVAQTLKDTVRAHDVVGRFGGDEFVVLMVDLTLKQAEYRFSMVLRALRALAYSNEQQRPLTASGGLAEFSAGDSFEGLLKRADHALYEAKRAGKDRVAAKAAPFIRDLRAR